MLVIAIIFGAVFGGMLGEGFGAAAGAMLAWLFVRTQRLQQQLAALREEMAALRQLSRPDALPKPAVDAETAEVEPQTSTPAPAAAVSAVEPRFEPKTAAAEAMATQARAVPSDELANAPAVAPASTLAKPPVDPPAKLAKPAVSTPSPVATAWLSLRAWLLGGNTIAKAGVGILFVGLAFLAKYASDKVTVPVELRLAGIAAVALVLLVLGWRLRQRRPAYAQALQGGAVAVLYLTLFVAFRFYGVLAVGPVFAAMVAVAALAAALAVLQDARALAVIGALGGFATPLLVSSGSGNVVALFAYYLVLDLGIAAVAWHKTWRALNLIGFIATFVVGTAWGVLRYDSDHYASSQAFLIAFFLLFNAILLMPARRLQAIDESAAGPQAHRWVNGSLLFGLPTITFALQYGLVQDTLYGPALSALALAAFYVAMAYALRGRPALAVPFEGTWAIAIVFLTLVIPFALDARSTAGAWALEGAGLIWLGLRQTRLLPRLFGYALLVIAGGAIALALASGTTPTTIFNATLFSTLMLVAGAFGAACFVQRTKGLSSVEAVAEPALIAWATLWALVGLGVQIDAFVARPYIGSAWLAGISGVAWVYIALSVRLRWTRVAAPTLAHAPLLAIAVLSTAVELDSRLAGGGWWAWPVALATHAAVLARAVPLWPRAIQHAVHLLGALVVAGLGALEGRAVTQAWGDAASAWPWLGWLLVPALLLLALTRPASARRWPVRALPEAYQGSAAGVLTLGLLLWTLLANVASTGVALPLPYLPLLNPLDLGVGCALFASAQWLRSAAAPVAVREQRALQAGALGATSFVWLNAMLIRAFHHYGGVPFDVDAWSHSLAVQTGITLLWAVTALLLMWWAARRVERPPWMAGAALLAAVVLKLVLVDLSGSGTLTRIVSFIGVGVLMLVIGYVAPLPAKEATHAPG